VDGQLRRAVADRRSVVVVPDEQASARVAAMYGEMAAAWAEVLTHYTDEQLAVILDLFQRLGEMPTRQVEQLRRSGRSGQTDRP
jgi:hypothetical protein